MKILLVEDEDALRKPLIKLLAAKKYTVESAINGKEALEKYDLGGIDLIILDINLPIIDGMEVCKRIRETSKDLPIIMLTARIALEDKIQGLDLGADDYIEKPFEFEELVARIEAVKRRTDSRSDTLITSFDQKLMLDVRKKRVWLDKTEINLNNKEYLILEYLMRNLGKIISQEELFEHVWHEESDPFSKTVKAQVNNLRNKLDSENKEHFIKTLKNQGYILE